MKYIIVCALFAFSMCRNSKMPATVPTPEGAKVEGDSLPVCVTALIEKFKSEERSNPPRSITRFKYKGKFVYYIPGPCCDNYSDLYNDSCRLMGHPDGGFTGKGDGSLPDFRSTATDQKLLWEDTRNNK